ncbi:hypothetical protein VE03_10188 [Pseudogymnoascus sp. 23342-1-I1]|nr:hypothetical protein VE03_10188 [Pseudogymnoascus sp. 23342-1-I1]
MTVIGEIKPHDMALVDIRPDLHDDLPEFERVKLPSLPLVVVGVELARPYGVAGVVESDHPQQTTAWYIQAVGDMDAGCDQCVHDRASTRARPFFSTCHHYGELQEGACGNCAMKHKLAACSLSHKKTWRPATPPPPPSPKAGKRSGTRAFARQKAIDEEAAA